MHPVIEEFCRAHDFQPHYLRRAQRELREQIQPLLDEGDVAKGENLRLREENADLRDQLDRLKKKRGGEQAA